MVQLFAKFSETDMLSLTHAGMCFLEKYLPKRKLVCVINHLYDSSVV